jgi:hypothetical protein
MIPKNVQTYLKEIGRKGGQARAQKLDTVARASQARKAVLSRWMKKRFGVRCFEEMSLPGSEIIDAGLRDLVHGNLLTVNALAVAEARPKLRFLGVPVPEIVNQISGPRQSLYQKMEEEHAGLGYARFCAVFERVDSFCHALASIIDIPEEPSHRERRWYV